MIGMEEINSQKPAYEYNLMISREDDDVTRYILQIDGVTFIFPSHEKVVEFLRYKGIETEEYE